ncbi:MAG: amino acid ABC transporter substrate-binding protein [Syntrophobacteraceae bacterium]|jgi:general L-amino acid transport system substrate-binding protein
MKKARNLVFLIFCMMALSLFYSPAEAGDTLTRIKARGDVRCGVSDGDPGFSVKEPDGRWSGIDADFCRALAAAVLGDPGKVDFVSLAASARFPSLKAGEIDVLVRNTTWTLEREATLAVMFTGILYYDGQGFLVSAGKNVQDLSQLNGAAICVVKGTTHEANLADYFRARNWSLRQVTVESQAKAAEALFSGQCEAFTSERPQLTTMRLKAPGGPEEYVILPDQISKEPMGPVLRRGDDEWFTIVRWVLFALIRAEETGLTLANLQSGLEARTDPLVQRWLELDGMISKALAIPPGWVTRVVESVGNYGEIYERNLGSQSPLKLERGPNRLWTRGGLMYSPPFY